jgi:nitrogenase molybdenum-iron protein alpha/beta subunit
MFIIHKQQGTCTYSNIDDDLDALTKVAQAQNPGIGIRLLKGFLRSQGHRIQVDRIRETLLRTDPNGLMQIWIQAVKRRKYQVPAPSL